MFASHPEFQFHSPVGPLVPGTMYWRALTTTVNTAWYILNVVIADEAGTRYMTLLFWWDIDLVKAVEQLAPERIESLIVVLPAGTAGAECGRSTIEIEEVWEVDQSSEHGDHLLLVDRDGNERIGMMGEVCDHRLPRRRLLERVGEPRKWGIGRQ